MTATALHDVIQRHPLAFSSGVVLTVVGIELLLKTTHDLLSLDLAVITVGIISGALISLLGAVAVSRLGLWRQLGLVGRPARPRAFLWFLPFVIYGGLPLTAGVAVGAGQAAAALVFGLLIAFWKLTVLGLLLYALLPRGARNGAALAAAFWAGMHLVGGILTGAIVLPTLVLVLSYFFLALAFAAIRLRTGLLWPLVGAYALLLTTAAAAQTGTASNLATSVADLLPAVGVSVLLAGYGLAAWPPREASVDPSQTGEDPTAAPKLQRGSARTA